MQIAYRQDQIEKDDIEERMEKTEPGIDQLIRYFEGHGYEAAATYMRRAEIRIVGYIRRRIISSRV